VPVPSGRQLASYLGLTPRESSSGIKRYLGRISKRGDGYLRTLLIHGARSVLPHARKDQPDRFRSWAHQLESAHPHNKAAVAVANKMRALFGQCGPGTSPARPGRWLPESIVLPLTPRRQ
jgi:transposase